MWREGKVLRKKLYKKKTTLETAFLHENCYVKRNAGALYSAFKSFRTHKPEDNNAGRFAKISEKYTREAEGLT